MNIYNAAAAVVDRVRSKHGGIRSALYALPINHALRPIVQALAQESLKHADALIAAANSCGILDELNEVDSKERVDSKRFNTLPSFSPENLYVVLSYELLVGPQRKLKGAHQGAIQVVREAASKLQEYLSRHHKEILKEIPVKKSSENAFPRYVRVNTLKMTPEAAKEIFQKQKIDVHIHQHVPELLVLPPGTNLHGHNLVKKGCVFIQDLASCLPVSCLAPQAASHHVAIDACAAPGNKTTQLAAKLALGKKHKVKVVAFERAPARAKALKQTIEKAGAKDLVTVVETDFLTIDVDNPEWADATLALCDPSCSGSRNVKVGEALPDHTPEEIKKFADHQYAIIRQAMSLPKMRTVVYSTCSVYQIENEDVVDRVLTECKGTWRCVKALPDWTQRGVGNSRMAPRCVRAFHEQQTHGFFVSVFERVDVSEPTLPADSTERKRKSSDETKRVKKPKK